LELVDNQNGTARPVGLPPVFFGRMAAELGSEPFERSPQGDFEKHEVW
jgi:hypothetical protein